MTTTPLRIDGDRLLRRLMALGEVGAIEGGGVCRLALTDEDRAGRDLVVRWMHELGLSVTIDRIGNVVGTRAGTSDSRPDRKSTRLNSSHLSQSRMPSSA